VEENEDTGDSCFYRRKMSDMFPAAIARIEELEADIIEEKTLVRIVKYNANKVEAENNSLHEDLNCSKNEIDNQLVYIEHQAKRIVILEKALIEWQRGC
jgi:hypothetical protein